MSLFILLTITSFLRTLLIIILVWYAFKVIVRLLAPRIVEKAAQKIVRDMQQQQQPGRRNEGEITIERQPKREKQFDRSKGEYIDFEEIN